MDNKDKTNINIRGIDVELYSQFKGAIYTQGFKSIKQAIIAMMKAAISSSKKNQ